MTGAINPDLLASLQFQAPPPPEPERSKIAWSVTRVADEGVTAVYHDLETDKFWLDLCDGSDRKVVKQDGAHHWREVNTGIRHDRRDGEMTAPPIDPEDDRPDWNEPKRLPARGDMGECPAFPTGMTPKALQDAAREVARFAKVPASAPVLVGIGALATAIGKSALVQEREGLTHHPALFLVGIAESGERKSPVFRYMTEPLEAWAMEHEAEWEEETRRAKARNAAVDSQIRRVKGAKDIGLERMQRDIEDLEAERLPMPPRPKLFTTDATEERVFQMLHERGGALAVMSGEGRPIFDSIMGKYSGESRTGDAVYLAGISGDTISRDRVGSSESGPEDRVIRRPCLNVCVLVQPDKYLEAASHPALRASGALARIWPVWLPPMAGQQHEEPGERGLWGVKLEPFNALVSRLLNHVPVMDDQGRPRPHIARLSPAAAEARRVFHNAIQDMMPEGGELADCKDIAAKAVSQTCKLALVLHLAARPEALEQPDSEIDAATWAASQAIGTWFLTEAVRVQRAAAEDPILEAARRVLAWCARTRRDTLSAATLSQEGPRPRPKAAQASEILDLLTEYRWMRPEKDPGMRRPIYRLSPLFSQFSQFSRGIG